MATSLTKHAHFVLISLLVVLLLLAWFFPSAGLVLGIAFLLLSFLIVSFVVIRKQREAYRSGRTTRGAFVWNTVLEIAGAGLAMVAAGLLGRSFAGIATAQIDNDLLRFTAGIAIGLLTGLGVGFLLSQTWGRLVRASAK